MIIGQKALDGPSFDWELVDLDIIPYLLPIQHNLCC